MFRFAKRTFFGPSLAHKNSQFVVGFENGFLPVQDPLVRLPKEFDPLESLLQRMPLTRADGKRGLLYDASFAKAVNAELPLIEVDSIQDGALLTALFRDYTFAASGYLLEDCDLQYRKTKEFGLGKKVLPANLAVPLAKVSAKIGAKPFMEYAQSYALCNYKKLDPGHGLEYKNLGLIRTFSGCQSETGFILVHVAMVASSGKLVKAVYETLEAAKQSDRLAFNNGMSDVVFVLKEINATMETMWGESLPHDYNSFRTFIMGTKNQPMFPDGVVYEGVSKEPTFFRGESGANDSIVPTCDNLLQLTDRMPSNPLTEILRDFRTYRPTNHNEWLQYVESSARDAGVRKFALDDPSSAILYLLALDQIRDFRSRHWNFTKQYIIRYTDHPVATGGSPIVSWLPNQLSVVLESMKECKVDASKLNAVERQLYTDAVQRATVQKRVLDKDVKTLGEKLGKKAVAASIKV